ncbi:MAG: PQQ-dependent sugar dehydrogenase, partial [Chitinophagaceae bacterium]
VIPLWKGNLFIGAMALKDLNRLVIENNKVIKEERLLKDKNWRVRSVKQGPDGYLYIGVDGGKILRIMPN